MPHLTIEYSSNLEERADLDAICRAALKAIVATPVFEVGAARVRAIRCDHYAIADQSPENAFVHMTLRIGAGRTPEEKKGAGDLIFGAVTEALGPFLERPHFGLSLEIREIDPDLSWKRNTMHARLRNAAER